LFAIEMTTKVAVPVICKQCVEACRVNELMLVAAAKTMAQCADLLSDMQKALLQNVEMITGTITKEKEAIHAQKVSGDAGQVPGQGDDQGQGPGEGGEDLQRPEKAG
jgi:hypothetical protein